MSDPVATPKDLQDYMNKQNMGQSAAQKFLNDYLRLKEMALEYDSPVIEHLRTKLETGLKQHGIAVLEQHEPKPEWTMECECGKKVNLNRAYFHVYNEVWKSLTGIIKEWYKKNTAIKEAARR